MADKFERTLGGAWESFREKVGPYTMYCCRRPEDYGAWKANGHPWAHVYIMKYIGEEGGGALDIGGEIIERASFNEVSPLEMQSVIYEMRAKYSP